MNVRAVRGAITVTNNDKGEILSATKEMLEEMMQRNHLNIEQVISIHFSATKDITKVYPAVAARELGLTASALFCSQEMLVEGSLPMCIRAMMHVESNVSQREINHVYLRGAIKLRPDLVKNFFAVAIDGPSGAGKSTVAKALSEKLGFIHVDTGAMYRAVALYGIENNRDLDNKIEIENFVENISIELKHIQSKQHIFLNGMDVTDKIRNQQVAEGSSKVAVVEKVRRVLTKIQQDIALCNNVVMDGRDIGACVLPGAQVKIYLDADTFVRAQRRVAELAEKGITSDINEVEKEIIKRDIRDKNREHSPLCMAEDAVFLDTSHMTMEEVINTMLSIVAERSSLNVISGS